MKYLFLSLLFTVNAYSALDFNQFVEVKEAVAKAFLELRPNSSHTLIINQKVGNFENYWWDLDEVHASYSGYENDGKTIHHIFLFGGFARLDEMTKDGLAVTACHEIGHGLGGAPYKANGSSQEGQADYFSTNICLPIVFKYLKNDKYSNEVYVQELCKKDSNSKYCLRAMAALKSDIHFFEILGDYVRYDQRSYVLATELNHADTFYPDSQCRLDTMIHGVLKLERPNCWFPEGIERKI